MKRILAILALAPLLSGCGLLTLFTGVAEGPNGRTNAGAGLVTWTHPSDLRCPDGGFQGAVNAASFSGSCKIGADGSREETFNVTGADSGSVLAKVLEAQTQQNKDSAAAVNQALGTVLASPIVQGALAGATGGASLLVPKVGAATSPQLGQPAAP